MQVDIITTFQPQRNLAHQKVRISVLGKASSKEISVYLEGKVAIITGSGSGIGRASAMKFAREGVKVVVAEYNEETGRETQNLIREAGGEMLFVQTKNEFSCERTRHEERHRAIEQDSKRTRRVIAREAA